MRELYIVEIDEDNILAVQAQASATFTAHNSDSNGVCWPRAAVSIDCASMKKYLGSLQKHTKVARYHQTANMYVVLMFDLVSG